MMTSSCLNLLYLHVLVKDSCIMFILFLCYIHVQQLLAVSESSCWSVARTHVLLRTMPIN